MTAEIIRIEVGIEGTFGALLLDGKFYCVTLELPWRGNTQNVSSIPAGKYDCMRVQSPLIERITGGKWTETFMVMGVPGRSGILLHSGTFVENTHGCILLASGPGKLRGKRAILNTGQTFNDFLTITRGVNSFFLTIREVDLTPIPG